MIEKLRFVNARKKKFEITVSWKRMMKGLLKQKNSEEKLRKMKILGRWRIFSLKILHRSQQKVVGNAHNWKRFTKLLIKNQRNRRLFVRERFSRLIRKYVLYNSCLKQIYALSRFRHLAKKALKHSYVSKILKARDNWRRLTKK